MGASESHYVRGIFAVHAALIASQHPSVLLIGAGHNLSQTALLGFDTLGVSIARSHGPRNGHNRPNNGDDDPPVLDHQGDTDQHSQEQGHT